MAHRSRYGGLPGTLRPGFTLIEMFTAMVLIAVLSSIAFGKFNKSSANRSAVGARDAYVWLGRRARALAIQRGTVVRMTLNPTTEQARLWLGQTGVKPVLGSGISFRNDFKVNVATSSGDSIVVCYSPRGFALTGTCTTSGLPKTATFSRAGQFAVATVQPLGQVEAKP